MRLFIAVNLTEDVRISIHRLIAGIRLDRDPVRWISPGNIHLTLKFLGEVSPVLCEPVEGVIRDAVSRHPPFDLALQGVGAFPDIRRPRVVWIGVKDGEALSIIKDVYHDIEDGLERLGFNKEKRAFHPHLTIGRIRSTRKGKDKLSPGLAERLERVSLPGERLRVESVELMESILRPTGAEYHAKASIPLAGRR
jgi:2'-5' RNA ligase